MDDETAERDLGYSLFCQYIKNQSSKANLIMQYSCMQLGKRGMVTL